MIDQLIKGGLNKASSRIVAKTIQDMLLGAAVGAGINFLDNTINDNSGGYGTAALFGSLSGLGYSAYKIAPNTKQIAKAFHDMESEFSINRWFNGTIKS